MIVLVVQAQIHCFANPAKKEVKSLPVQTKSDCTNFGLATGEVVERSRSLVRAADS